MKSNLKSSLLLAVAAFAFTHGSPAGAADVPRPVLKAPPAASPTYSWTGLYVGGGLGYGMFNLDTTWAPGALPFDLAVNQTQGGRGWLGTVTVGGDYQFNDRLVVGVFADYDFANIKGSLQNQGPFTVGTVKEKSAWAVGGRLGVLVTPSILTYASGGYTRARFSNTNMVVNEIIDPFLGQVASQVAGHTYSGWFVGSGIEARLDGFPFLGPNWFWRNEYRYAKYDSASIPDVCINDPVCQGSTFIGVPAGTVLNTATIRPIVQTVRSQVIYKFAAPGSTQVRAAPPSAPVGSWTGFYAGAGFGYGMFNLDTRWTGDSEPFTLPLTQTQGGRGWLGTVSIGADYQFNDRIVVGVFADYDWTNMKGTLQYQGDFRAGTTKQDRAWAVGARAGWLATPSLMTYVNAGYTRAHFSAASMAGIDTLDPNFGIGIETIPANTYSGWFIGSGLEARLDELGVLGRGWFWRNEYRYAQYRSADLPDVCTNPVECPGPPNFIPVGTVLSVVTVKPVVQTFRTELVYKFNWGGALIARN